MHVDPDTVLPSTTGRADTGLFDDVPVVREVGVDEPAREDSLREAAGREPVPGELAGVETMIAPIEWEGVDPTKPLDLTSQAWAIGMRAIRFDVLGKPAPKGSSRAFVNKKTGRAFVAPGGAKSTEERISNWNSAVREAALTAIGYPVVPPFVDAALYVAIVFHVARPKGHWGKGKRVGTILPSAPARPATKPDIDKLARTTLDAMTGAIFDDDSRIADLSLSKRWAMPGREGASITVREAR